MNAADLHEGRDDASGNNVAANGNSSEIPDRGESWDQLWNDHYNETYYYYYDWFTQWIAEEIKTPCDEHALESETLMVDRSSEPVCSSDCATSSCIIETECDLELLKIQMEDEPMDGHSDQKHKQRRQENGSLCCH